MNETIPNFHRENPRKLQLEKSILGIAQAYGPYKFWLENIAPIVNPDTTWRALMVLSALRDKAFVTQAIYLLKSLDSRVRAWSCYYLATVMHTEALDYIFASSNDPSPRVRFHARKAFLTMQPGSENIFDGNRRFMHAEFSVLISEDNPAGRANLALILKKQGFITYTAATERETIDIALKNRPQVIITDNQKVGLLDNKTYIDNISGLNMTWDICRLPELKETLLIMLTADELEPIFLWQGGDVFLSKMRFGGEILGMILQEFMR